jgi:hypothetical protein
MNNSFKPQRVAGNTIYYNESPLSALALLRGQSFASVGHFPLIASIGTIYSPDQVCGKTLYMNAGKTTNLRKNADINSALMGHVNGGEMVGVVYSYVIRDSGLWWWVNRNGAAVWVLHYTGAFDVQALAGQGALTPQEIQARKDEAEKSLGEKALDGLTGLLTKGLFIFGGVYLAKSILIR